MRAASSSGLVWILLVGLVVAACDHKERVTENPSAEAWQGMGGRMKAQAEELRTRQRNVAERVNQLMVPAGTEDITLANAIVELQNSMAPLEAALAKLEAVLAQSTADVGAALNQRDKRAGERALAAAKTGFDEAFANAYAAFAPLEPKVNAAESIMKRLLANVEAELNQLRRLAAAGGNLDFSAIDFKVGTADLDFTHPASKATLDRLVQFGSACPQLRFGLTGHTSKEGVPARNKELSQQRADAVRGYLVAQGVDPVKIVRTSGLGSTRTLADEPEPGSAAEAAMDPAVLEALRRTNRRVTIDVVQSCTPSAEQPVPVPAPGPTAAQVAPTPPTATVRADGSPIPARPTATRPTAQPPH